MHIYDFSHGFPQDESQEWFKDHDRCKVLDLGCVSACRHSKICFKTDPDYSNISGADPGFFLGGGALVSCSTSTP